MINRSTLNHFFAGLLFFACSIIGIQPALAEEFLEVDQAFPVQIEVQKQDIIFNFDIADGYYLYQDRFQFKINQEKIDNIQFPPAENKYDPNFKKNLQVFHGKTQIIVHTDQPIKDTDHIVFNMQGCAEGGLCYPPETLRFNISNPTEDLLNPIIKEINVHLDESSIKTHSNTEQSHITQGSEDLSIAQKIAQAPLWKIVFLCLGLGILLSLTPCVLPMLPILLRILVGQDESKPMSRSHTFKLSLAYVFGMSIIYTLLGILSASIGASLTLWIQNPYVLIGFGVVLFLFSLSMFDIFQLQMPVSIQNKVNQLSSNLSGGRYGHSFIMGMLSALICGPCIAAPLAGVLLFIAQSGQLTTGAVALFSLAWGQGLILLLLGLGASNIIPKAGDWMTSIKMFCGLLLIATSLWIMRPALADGVAFGLWATLLFVSAFMLGLFDPIKKDILSIFGKALGLISFVWGVLLIIGLALGSNSVLSPLDALHRGQSTSVATQQSDSHPIDFEKVNNAQELKEILENSTQPVFLKFGADWCIACHELDQNTFSDSRVQAELSQFKKIEIDMTHNTPEHKVLLKQFNLFGPPALLFFNPTETEPYRRIIGYINAEEFLNP